MKNKTKIILNMLDKLLSLAVILSGLGLVIQSAWFVLAIISNFFSSSKTDFDTATLMWFLYLAIIIFSAVMIKIIEYFSKECPHKVSLKLINGDTNSFIETAFECSVGERAAIAKYWNQISYDLIELASPDICTPAMIFEEAEKADYWQSKYLDYEKSEFGILNPRNSLKLRMFKRAANIKRMLYKIREFCMHTPSIVNVSEIEIVTAFEEYIAEMLDQTDQSALCEGLAKGMDHYEKIIANQNSQILLSFYRD